MGVRILHDSEQGYAALFCSTSDVAFGPIFTQGDKSCDFADADERAQSFLRWLEYAPKWVNYVNYVDTGRRDPRELTDTGLMQAYTDWLAQEADQMKREAAAEQARFDAEMADD